MFFFFPPIHKHKSLKKLTSLKFKEKIKRNDIKKEKKKKRKVNPTTNISKITKIILHKFRQFNEKSIPIANKLTVLAGHNATGKSTLLAILANSCEIKSYKPLIKSKFRGEFPDIIKASVEHDCTQSNVVEICFLDTSIEKKEFSVPFRTTWQNKTRYRLIPKHNGTESKLGYPIIYLGLSRLYPLGECSDSVKTSSTADVEKYFTDYPDDKAWIISSYQKILGQRNILDVSTVQHPDIKKKVFVGIANDSYNNLCNSSGQDNLGQILLGILSFKKLKISMEEDGNKWNGGLFLIDEIDATLHPAAQIKLLDLLYREAGKLNLQVVFTTHSLSTIKYFYNKKNISKDNIVTYITTKNKSLSITINPEYDIIKNDMLTTDPATLSHNLISVLTEDEETRWFLKEILPSHIFRQINLPKMKRGCESMASFNHETYPALSSSLIILDGDFKVGKYSEYNLLILPGGDSPEGIIYNFLLSLPADHELLNNSYGIDKRSLEEYGPFSDKYKEKHQREKYKHWFRDNEDSLMELNVISFWKEQHEQEITIFNNNFQEKLKSIKHKKR